MTRGGLRNRESPAVALKFVHRRIGKWVPAPNVSALVGPAPEGEESAWRLARRRLWLRGCPERAGGAVLSLAIPGAALAAVAIWGATPIATKIAVVDIAPLRWACCAPASPRCSRRRC
jgi:hypothetical protein